MVILFSFLFSSPPLLCLSLFNSIFSHTHVNFVKRTPLSLSVSFYLPPSAIPVSSYRQWCSTAAGFRNKCVTCFKWENAKSRFTT